PVVVLFDPFSILTGPYSIDPGRLIEIEAHCFDEPAFEGLDRHETTFVLDTCWIDGVPEVMARAIGDERDEVQQTVQRASRLLSDYPAYRSDDVDVAAFGSASDVVRLTDPPLLDHR